MATAQHTLQEIAFTATGSYTNPYTDLTAEAELTRPDGGTRTIPLFWDGGDAWTLRFSPDLAGKWSWKVTSDDPGLDGQSGSVDVTASDAPGGLTLMAGHPHHFARQNGDPVYFIGDTAWSLVTDDADERHDRAAAHAMIDKRVSQGYNVVHVMCISEAGWGNSGGDAFHSLDDETINPDYWKEVDERVAYANEKGVTVGLVLAWSDKGRNPNCWRAFPTQEARVRYARYMASRYAAYDVYFIVAGEWNADTRRDLPLSDEEIADEYREIGRAIRANDAHGRLIGIHPMIVGTAREFAPDDWCDFADYQQMYRDMHREALISRDAYAGPVVNSEYAYFLRDQDEDGVCDKQNSETIEEIRAATWDILMAGAYIITGYGSTYFGGHRHPGPFNLDDPANAIFEEQIQHAIRFWKERDWWTYEPADDTISAATPVGPDESRTFTSRGKPRTQPSPPKVGYWALKSPDSVIGYVRGLSEPVTLDLSGLSPSKARLYDIRTGAWSDLEAPASDIYVFTPPDADDWVVVVE